MNRTNLLALLLSVCTLSSAQTVTLPYNPDVDQDSAIGAGDLLGLLPLFGTNFAPGEVLVDGETLTDYISALEEAAANATSDTISLPMLPGTTPGEMLYWDGDEWSLVPVGGSGDALILSGATPTWRALKLGCMDEGYLEFDAEATIEDGSCTTAVVEGCTDPAYTEFDSAANTDDGSCVTLVVEGCTDSTDVNYNAAANTDDGSCSYSCSSIEFDGYTYAAVEIGGQCWFAENLQTTTYANGDVIPAGLTDGEWSSTNSGATAVYGEGSSDCYDNSPDIDACDEAQSLAEYGRLYNWHAVDDARGLCPSGWHVPTDGEWTELEDYITSQGFAGTEGTALKSTTGWYQGGNGTDDFGFSALPGGARYYSGFFGNAANGGYWWSSSPSGGDAWGRYLGNDSPFIVRLNDYGPRNGFSVRCLKDAEPTGVQGCTDPAYLEFDAEATVDDGSCVTAVVEGCTDPAYTEYDSAANTDDGSCVMLVVEGCTDSTDVNYNAAANTDDGSCSYSCSSIEFDGYTYAAVEIGGQCWFAENLRTTTYANGDVIPAGLTDGEWSSTTSGATAVYGEGSSDCYDNSPDIDACDEAQSLAEYGRLYNWYAVDDARGLCPSGWHVPTDGEWTELEDYITSQGFAGTEGTALKSTTGWYQGGNGTDDFGFSALPGGLRYPNGFFNDAGSYGYWWSSSPSGGNALYRVLSDDGPVIGRYASNPRYGFSVRCLRDAEPTGVQGCTDPGYLEFEAEATIDDGSCATAVVEGCTDPVYTEYDSAANTDDGSCATLASSCSDVEMDGYTYAAVEIGGQCWFAENLRTTTYANGDVIPGGLTGGEWSSTTSDATAVYGEGSSGCNNSSPNIDACDEAQSLAEYGRLYNWYAVDDARGLCPSGWHVPTDGEWTELADYVTSQGFAGTEGTALKSTTGWYQGGNGTDDFGFSALPGGYRIDNGSFYNAGTSGSWWSSSPSGGDAWFRDLYYDYPDIVRNNDSPRSGFSVRCLRDAE